MAIRAPFFGKKVFLGVGETAGKNWSTNITHIFTQKTGKNGQKRVKRGGFDPTPLFACSKPLGGCLWEALKSVFLKIFRKKKFLRKRKRSKKKKNHYYYFYIIYYITIIYSTLYARTRLCE